jgi:hypothetical protein
MLAPSGDGFVNDLQQARENAAIRPADTKLQRSRPMIAAFPCAPE